ncbi:helix-turn-helix transcriptional regulator [Sporolactobacillus inulinus]|jgi:CBS domain-containing protein|uniref:CBS domain protein, lmo1865 homolog n=1 Tax=Sporolactobacillus inulinus TaxID=2078 RepID=A0A4Y1ZBS2_9BACL|nr:helix-turn-helix transcriptional regulator [Sporolactobacillus inulinus]GAY76381.1 CBS domain protein, lmo1865 homolog [Sporolactobacillus inulinus]
MGGTDLELNDRQHKIIEIVREQAPITGEQIAEHLNVTRATLRPDLSILTMSGFLEARPRVGYFYTGQTSETLLYEEIRKLTVGDFQSLPIVISEAASAYQAVCEMFVEDVGSLFVIDEEGLLTGVLSRKDLLRTAIGSQDMNQVPVSVIMSRMPNIAYCRQNDTVVDVADLLITKEVDSVPVVHTKGNGFEVVGRMTKTNITKAFVSLGKRK